MSASIPRPHNPYFLIKTSRTKEKEKKEKIGSIYIHQGEAFMQYNLPSGEIVAISDKAHQHFPEAKIGNELLIHHFVAGFGEKDARAEHLIHQDEDFNYYVVTPIEHNGKGVEAYAIWDGENLIPNKEYVFLDTDTPPQEELPEDEFINQSLEVSEGGLLVFKEWNENRESKETRQNFIKKEIEDLSKSGNHKPHIQKAIMEKEMEMAAIANDINKQKYSIYTVAHSNPLLSVEFGIEVKKGSKIAMLNMAAQTKIVFNGVEYIVAKIKYIGFVFND